VSWGVLLLVPGASSTGRTRVVLVFGGLFGLGEMLLAPTLSPLVNALATDRLRGRYNALSGATFSIAFVVSRPCRQGWSAPGSGSDGCCWWCWAVASARW